MPQIYQHFSVQYDPQVEGVKPLAIGLLGISESSPHHLELWTTPDGVNALGGPGAGHPLLADIFAAISRAMHRQVGARIDAGLDVSEDIDAVVGAINVDVDQHVDGLTIVRGQRGRMYVDIDDFLGRTRYSDATVVHSLTLTSGDGIARIAGT